MVFPATMNQRQYHITGMIAMLLMLLGVNTGLRAQTVDDPRREWVRSTASDIEFNASNYGIFGVNLGRGRSGFVYPRSSDISYMFGSGLWFGTKKRVGGTLTKLLFSTFNPKSGSSWATPGEAGEAGDTSTPAPLYNSIDYNRNGEYGRVPIPTAMAHWPLWLRPGGGTSATALNPGVFVVDTLRRTTATHEFSGAAFFPEDESQRVEELMVSRFNDANLRPYELTDSLTASLFPLGLQFQQNVYSWRRALFSNMVLVQYEIRNTSQDTLFDCVIAQVSDPDIGISTNDHLRYYSRAPEYRAGYVWSGPEGKAYGALAMTLVEAPMVDSQGFINNSRRSDFKSVGRLGSFPHWARSREFATLADQYDFMTSGELATDVDENDQLSLMGSTAFNMRPGDVAHFAVAYMVIDSVPEFGRAVGRRGRSMNAVDDSAPQLDLGIASLLEFYYRDDILSAIDNKSGEAVDATVIYPNPVRETARLRFSGRDAAPTRLLVTDILGRIREQRDLGILAGAQGLQIDCRNYASGIYFVRLEQEGTPTIVARMLVQR